MIKLKKLREFASHIKIRTKLFLLILITGALCLTLFRFLWQKKWNVYYFLADNMPSSLQFFPLPDDDFWMKLDEEAKKYDIPDSDEDEETVKAIEPFFSLADEYTSIYIYGLEDGLFRAGIAPEAMLWNEPFNTFFQMTYRWIDEDVNQYYDRPIEFKNGYATVIIYFYHSSFFIVPYAVFCLFVCIFLFLFVILHFVGKKLKTIARLEKDILQMSAGDLTTPIPGAGFDEIGILALELDKLRFTLQNNLLHEQNLHKSNQELIAALSHDLRTPLTILKGYLEIVRLNPNHDMQTEYLNRCIQKTEDIKEMTNRMFEYALAYGEADHFADDMLCREIPITFFSDTLKEHSDFLNFAGFHTDIDFSDFDPSEKVIADPSLLKRIFNNLFSNIIKYADKKETVFISVSFRENLVILIKNSIKTKNNEIESTQIGLKSVQKMIQQMNGSLILHTKEEIFTAELHFPILTLQSNPVHLQSN